MSAEITLGPQTGELLLFTACEGAMARMGHDLTLAVTDWGGSLTLAEAPAECRVEMRANLHSLTVRDSRGGQKPAQPGDFAKIEKNARGAFGDPALTFRSTAVDGTWQKGTLRGDVTMNGQTHPQTFAVEATTDGWTLTGTITQTRWGLKPFSTMMGALRLADDVRVEAAVRRPGD